MPEHAVTADPRRAVALAVAALRLGYGSAMVVAPRLLLRLQFGVEPSGPFVWTARAFGARDAILGAGALLAPGETERRGWVAAGAAADGTDMVTAALGRKWLGRRNSVLVTVVAAAATAAAGWALSGGTERR